jgi:ribonuclease HI
MLNTFLPSNFFHFKRDFFGFEISSLFNRFFICGKVVATVSPRMRTKKFYGVRKGRKPGLYTTWAECLKQTHQFPNAQFKSFSTLDEAESYLNTSPSKSTNHGIISSTQVSKFEALVCTEQLMNNPPTGTTVLENGEEILHVYCDGACQANGKSGAKAGIGIWFGPNDDRNVSEPIQGKPTNIRAEMLAAIKALEITKGVERMVLYTDSQFLLKGLGWLPGWKKNGWKTASNTEVSNQDLWKILDSLYQERKHAIRFQFLYGHRSSTGNIGADELATLGAQRYVQ